MKHYTLQVTTLSPVHVATGEAMRPGDYLVHDHRLYEFGRWGLSRALNDDQRKELLQLLDNGNAELPLRVQRFLAREAGSLCAAAERMQPLLPGIADYCQDKLGQQMQAKAGGRPGTINQLELMRQTGAEFAEPYIPGSTLKGAIRGALVDMINNKKPPSIRLSSNFDPRELRSDTEEQRLLDYKSIDDDPFRFLLVGDAVKAGDNPVELDYWLVNRLRLAPKAGKEQNTNLQLAPVECIAPLQSAVMRLELRLKSEPVPGCIKKPELKEILTDFANLAKMVNQISLPGFLTELAWLEQNNIAVAHGGNSSLGVLADDIVIVRKGNRLAQLLAQADSNGGQAELGLGAVLRLAQMAAQDDLSAVGNQLLDGRQCGVDAVIVGDNAVLHRDVEVAANQYALAGVVLIVNGLFTQTHSKSSSRYVSHFWRGAPRPKGFILIIRIKPKMRKCF